MENAKYNHLVKLSDKLSDSKLTLRMYWSIVTILIKNKKIRAISLLKFDGTMNSHFKERLLSS